MVTKNLHEIKYVFVNREPRENIWMYHNCNYVDSIRRTNYLQSLSSTVVGDGLTAATAVYDKCIHIEAFEKNGRL